MIKEGCRGWDKVQRGIGYWVLGAPHDTEACLRNSALLTDGLMVTPRGQVGGIAAPHPWQEIGHHMQLPWVGGCRLSHPSTPPPPCPPPLVGCHSRSKCILGPVLAGPGHSVLWSHNVVHFSLC